ncbi:MAG: hypothetical protein AB7U66_19910 [Hyphomicrobiaceae bacterium]
MRRLCLALLLLAGLHASVALARTITLATQRGKPTSTNVYHSWTARCATARTKVVIVRYPTHGQVSIQDDEAIISHADTGSVGRCKGRKVKGKKVVYEPFPDYSGVDAFTIRVTYANGASVVEVVNLRVD